METDNMESKIVCQGLDCKEHVGVECYEKEQEHLCLTCAFKKGYGVGNQKRNRYWHCGRHDEFVKYYCVKDDTEACQVCVIVDHSNCKVKYIDDAITQKREELGKIAQSVADIRKTLSSKIAEGQLWGMCHLGEVEKEVKSYYNHHKRKAEEIERSEIAQIEKDAEEEIMIIVERKEARMRISREKAEKQRQSCDEERQKMLKDIEHIGREYLRVFKKVGNETKDIVESTRDQKDDITYLLQKSDRTVLNDGNRVTASATKFMEAVQMKRDVIKKTYHKLKNIMFKGPEMGPGLHISGRIGGYDGNWGCISSVKIPDRVENPGLFGCVSDDEIAFQDQTVGTVYTIDLNTGMTKEMLGPEIGEPVCSCVLLERDVVVCGKKCEHFKDDTIPSCVNVYEKQQGEWVLVKEDIGIPKSTSSSSSIVYVNVDIRGKILAGELAGTKIFVIDPADGQFETIQLENKSLCGRFLSFSSGNLLLRDSRLCVVERSGKLRNVIHDDGWGGKGCCVDHITDLLYVTYRDKEHKCNLVDEVSSEGLVTARRILDYPAGTVGIIRITPSGSLVCFNGREIFVYRKMFYCDTN